MLEEGVAPWQKPWESAVMPINPTSGREYRGSNAIHLMTTGMAQGYDDPRWMTYTQASENGRQVRQGLKSKSEDRNHSSGAAKPEQENEKTDRRLIHRVYTVSMRNRLTASHVTNTPSEPDSKSFSQVNASWQIPAQTSLTISVTVLSTIASHSPSPEGSVQRLRRVLREKSCGNPGDFSERTKLVSVQIEQGK